MKKYIRNNIVQWHREQRDRALKRVKDGHPEAQRDADRHARILADLTK